MLLSRTVYNTLIRFGRSFLLEGPQSTYLLNLTYPSLKCKMNISNAPRQVSVSEINRGLRVVV